MKSVLFATFALCFVPYLNAEQPNVIVILTDDQGWGDLSLSGNTNLSTPNIDSIAAQGASFDRFYVSPVCSPTRAEFLTGRYHQRSGVYSTSAGGERMDLDEITIADVFQKEGGYRTGAFGKWHNGMQYPYHPNGRGFEEFYGFCSGHWGDYFSPMLEHNGEIVEGEGFVVDDFTDKAISFIEENRDDPFFVYLPYNTPHSPMQVPDEYWDRFKDKELTMRHREPQKENDLHLRCALAMCENIDWNVGRILETLDQLDLTKETIILYFCDNGPNGARWNGGMKGKKGSTDEGGVRSPLVIRWPGKIPAGMKVDTLGSAIDLLPTLVEMAGLTTEGLKPLDGESLASALLSDDGADPQPIGTLLERQVFSGWKGRSTVRTPRFRLSNEGQLFDMVIDPGQTTDVSEQHPEIHAKLSAELEAWAVAMATELGTDDRPFGIAHHAEKITQIPARDGIPQGAIERSNKYPNDSFFTNWTSLDDAITWDVEVLAAGEFEAVIYYTCEESNVGSTIELSCGSESVTGKVETAHSTARIGASDDRAPRMESYTQDFGSMSLGGIRLEKGPATLSMRALEIPGDEVMDFRLLLLERK